MRGALSGFITGLLCNAGILFKQILLACISSVMGQVFKALKSVLCRLLTPS